MDNCDGNWSVVPKKVVDGDTCSKRITCTWSAKDKAGNTVTAVQQMVEQDTMPPVISPRCAAGAFCVNEVRGLR